MRWPRFLTPTHLSYIIRSTKNPSTAIQIFNEAKSRYPKYRHNGLVYATMISILGNSGRLTEMTDVIDQMKEDSCECKDRVFAMAIKTYAEAGLLDEAVSLFKTLHQFNCANWTESFNTLLEIMVKASKLETVHRLYLENSNAWEVKSRVNSLNLLIDVLCKKNRSDLGLQIFQEMNDQCCYPDRETYRILMRGLCEDGRLNEATHLLYSMFWRISLKGSGEDVSIYRMLLEALCDNGQIEEATEILSKILRKGLKAPKGRRRPVDLKQCLTGEGLEGVKSSINGSLIRGVVPSSSSFSAMAVDLYCEGKFDHADQVLDQMHHRGFRPSVMIYEGKLSALCREHRVEEAVKVIEKEMVEGNRVPTVRTYNIMLKGLCDDGKAMRTLGYVEKMAKQVGCVADKETFGILVDGLCSKGHFVEASRVLEKMQNRGYWPGAETYNVIIRGLCYAGRMYEAVMWLEEMVSQGKLPSSFVWNSLTVAVCSSMVEAGNCVDKLKRL